MAIIVTQEQAIALFQQSFMEYICSKISFLENC